MKCLLGLCIKRVGYIVIVGVIFFAQNQVFAQETHLQSKYEFPPQDHGGQDFIIEEFGVVWGKHTGIRNFTVSENALVVVSRYRPDEPKRGSLEIFAETIRIAGEIDGWGAGYTGGGGGGGGGSGGHLDAFPYIAPDGGRLIQAGQDGRSGGGKLLLF